MGELLDPPVWVRVPGMNEAGKEFDLGLLAKIEFPLLTVLKLPVAAPVNNPVVVIGLTWDRTVDKSPLVPKVGKEFDLGLVDPKEFPLAIVLKLPVPVPLTGLESVPKLCNPALNGLACEFDKSPPEPVPKLVNELDLGLVDPNELELPVPLIVLKDVVPPLVVMGFIGELIPSPPVPKAVSEFDLGLVAENEFPLLSVFNGLPFPPTCLDNVVSVPMMGLTCGFVPIPPVWGRGPIFGNEFDLGLVTILELPVPTGRLDNAVARFTLERKRSWK